MPEKGDLVVEIADPSVVYEIVRIVQTPTTAVLLSGGVGSFAVREVPQSDFGLYRMYTPPIVAGQRWADDRGRTYTVLAVFTDQSVTYVVYRPVDNTNVAVVTEQQFRAHGTLVVDSSVG